MWILLVGILLLNNCESSDLFGGKTSIIGDQQVDFKFTRKSNNVSLYYYSTVDGPLSFIISPCMGPLYFSLFFYTQNNPNSSQVIIHPVRITNNFQKMFQQTSKGWYEIHLENIDEEIKNFGHIYVSTEFGGPQALQQGVEKLKIVRQYRNQLFLRWNLSLVDPQSTSYCIVASETEESCLCQAIHKKTFSKFNKIHCIGKRNQFILKNQFTDGKKYFFQIFAINGQSNFTYLFANTSLVYQSHSKALNLPKNITVHLNLRNYSGRAIFKYKIGKGKDLNLFVLPCRGSVNVEIIQQGGTLIEKRQIDDFQRIYLSSNRPMRYYFKIESMEEDFGAKSVEIFVADSKYLHQMHVPLLPPEVKLYEYTSLKSCDSVTIGWMAAKLASKNATSSEIILEYCIIVREGKTLKKVSRMGSSIAAYEINQCGLNKRLKKSDDFHRRYCKHFKQWSPVIVEKIGHLKQGKNYVIQVLVKTNKAKILSYNLLEVQTKVCHTNKKIIL